MADQRKVESGTAGSVDGPACLFCQKGHANEVVGCQLLLIGIFL